MCFQEAKIIKALNHPFIVKHFDSFMTQDEKLCIVMEFADSGDLTSKIKLCHQRRKRLTENDILNIITQILLGIKHVHDRKVIHRDLKCDNVFITKEGKVKIGDFGISKVLMHTMQKGMSMAGTPNYFSPEIISGQPYTSKTDVWSIGCILYELCALKPAFNDVGSGLSGLAAAIQSGEYDPVPSCYSSELNDLLESMLNTDSKQRLDIEQILALPIIHSRIDGVLPQSIIQDEFGHTVLHGYNVL